MTTQNILKDLGLPQLAQIGYVVRDMRAAVELYDPLFGPFKFMDGSVEQVDYRGRKADVGLIVGFGYSGDVEIELLQWTSGESPHREFIERGREGMHHLQFRVDDCDGWIEKMKTVGYAPIWYKRFSADTRFVYMERDNDPMLIEFLEMPRDRKVPLTSDLSELLR